MTIIDKACYERGCACYDDRVDKDGVEVVARKWVGLTDEEIDAMHYEIKKTYMGSFNTKIIYQALEAKLKEKNT